MRSGLFLDLRLRDRQAPVSGGGGGLRFTQFGKTKGADCLILGGVHLGRRALTDNRVAVASADCASASCALASVQRKCSTVASALRMSAEGS